LQQIKPAASAEVPAPSTPQSEHETILEASQSLGTAASPQDSRKEAEDKAGEDEKTTLEIDEKEEPMEMERLSDSTKV